MAIDAPLYDTSEDTKNGAQIRSFESVTDRLVAWILKEKKAASHVEKWRTVAKECYRFVDGIQTSEADKRALAAAGRPDNAFNSAQKFIRFVTGIERVAPESLVFNAIDESDVRQQIYGEFMTRIYDWALVQGDGNFERSRAFYDLCVGGMGWEDYYIDRSNDVRGLPKMTRLDPMEMWWPDIDRQNLAGSRWRGRETKIALDEALTRWPDDEEILRAAAAGGDQWESWRPNSDKQIVYKIRDVETTGEEGPPKMTTAEEVPVLEWQWYDDEPGYYFFDPIERSDVWLPDKEFRAYKSSLLLKSRYKIQDYAPQASRVHKKLFVLADRYRLGDVIKIPGNRFTFNPMTGTFDQDARLWYGYMRVLMDPQRYANKFFNQVIEIMAHSAKGGFLYEKGALLPSQVQDVTDNYAKPGTANEVNVNAISNNQIKEKPLPQLPAASIAVLQFCIQSMDTVTGLSPEANFAGPVADTPGVTLRQKTQSSMVLLAQEFASLSRFRIEEGKIIFNQLGIIADDRLIRVGGAFDGSVIKFMQQPFALEYDLILDDTERDPNIQNMYRDSVMSLAPTLIRMNKFLPELLDYAKFIPVKIRMLIKKAIQDSAKADAMAAQQGVSRTGRPAPESPEERAARISKINADTQLQQVKAARVMGQQKRDEMKTLMDAVVKSQQIALEKAKAVIEARKVGVAEKQGKLDVTSEIMKTLLAGEAHHQTERMKVANQRVAKTGT